MTDQSLILNSSMLRRWMLVCIVAISFGFHLWGIRQDLPYTHGQDEQLHVPQAAHMAASGNLLYPSSSGIKNSLGHPGATLLYPLVAWYHIWHALTYGGALLRPDPQLAAAFEANPSEFFLLGRLLTIAYGVLTVPLVYQVGRRAFREPVALIGAWLWVLTPIAVDHARIVRTDSASVFFGLLGLWACLKLYDRPTLANQLIAGLAVGLAIATKYYLAVLVPVLIVVNGLRLWQGTFRLRNLKVMWPGLVVGLLAVPTAFVLSAPFVVSDNVQALADLRQSTRQYQPGADGLSPPQNLVWYLSTAIPRSLGWVRTILLLIGVTLVAKRHQPKQIVLVGLTAIFLVGISLSWLHWQRWVLPTLPLLSLLAADALAAIIAFASKSFKLGQSARHALALSVIFLVSLMPAYQLILLDIRQARPSTRILAREWILQNLPPGSRIAQEAYTAPLDGTPFEVFNAFSLAANGYTFDDARRYGFRYVVVSSAVYARYMADPNRYPAEIASYERLFAQGRLIQQFEPSATRGGPVIRIYELPEPP